MWDESPGSKGEGNLDSLVMIKITGKYTVTCIMLFHLSTSWLLPIFLWSVSMPWANKTASNRSLSCSSYRRAVSFLAVSSFSASDGTLLFSFTYFTLKSLIFSFSK